MKYCEVAIGSVSNRGNIIAADSLMEVLKNNVGVELYRSYYSFDEEILDHFKKYKSVRTYKGKHYLDKIILDVDKGHNTHEVVLLKAQNLYQRIIDDFSIQEDHIKIYFSGNGYHLVIPDVFHFIPSNELSIQVKHTLEKYFPEADSIYDTTRIIRVVNSLNTKSGLYKIPLTPIELFTKYENIHSLAKQPRTINGYYKQLDETELPNLNHLIVYSVKEKTTTVPEVNSKLTNYVTCIQKIYQEEPTEGTRHIKLLRIVDAWKKTGIPIEATYNALIAKFNTMDKSEVKKVIDEVYKSEKIDYGCFDVVRAKYCDSMCIFYKGRNNVVNVHDANEAENKYIEEMKKDRQYLDFSIFGSTYKFSSGELSIFIGGTKLGKSAIVQNLVTFNQNKKVLYLSLEMSLRLTFRRFIQIANHMTKDDVDEFYRQNYGKLSDLIKHIKIVTTSPTIDDLRKMIIENRAEIVVIDTLDCMIIPGYNDENSKIGKVADGLRNIAQNMDVNIIGIHHISKHASQDEKGNMRKLTVHAGKGSSSVEQKADRILAFEGNRDEDTRILRTLGERDQSPIDIKLHFDKERFLFKRIT